MGRSSIRRVLALAVAVAMIVALPAPAIAAPAWFDRVNEHRSDAGLPDVSRNTSWEQGCWEHSRYMVKTDTMGHTEDPLNAWYTPAGAHAASRSNVLVHSGNYGDESSIDLWMTGPFHAVGILDPGLSTVGFGSYYESVGTWKYGATLNVLDGLGSIPPQVSFPVMWPRDGSIVDVYSYGGTEHPDPLTHTGWSAPSGLPIIAQFGGGGGSPVVTDSGFWEDGVAKTHSVFTETTYSNPNAADRDLGRAVLSMRDAVVLLPRSPLSPGHVYTCSLTVGGQEYTWSFATPGALVEGVDYEVVAGSDRYRTAVEISKETFPGGASTVVVATGLNWPDALGGAALAAAVDGPILLTGSTLPSAVRTEIRRLGATDAIILGGTGAVSPAVESALKSELGSSNVERIGGTSRYSTARRIAERVYVEMGPAFDPVAFVTSGENFPDALAASPLAAANVWPIYLTPSDEIPAITIDEMQYAGIEDVLVLGGTGAVSAGIKADLESTFGSSAVRRLSGSNRYATACRIADYGVSDAGLGWDAPGVATGLDFPDALAGGVMLGKAGSPLLLNSKSRIESATEAALESRAGSITMLCFLGGAGAIELDVREEMVLLTR